jgi:hypothetical protein
MIMRARKTLLTILVALLPIAAFAADADDLKKKIILDQKKLNVIENMPLTAEESEAFWYWQPLPGHLFELDIMRSMSN